MEWYSVVVGDVDYQAEWSSNGGMNLRVKHDKKGQWHYVKCPKAKYALSLVEQLLARRKKENEK